MGQQDYITLFTVRIGAIQDANVKLFYNNKNKFLNDEILDDYLILLNNDSNRKDSESLWEVKKACFNSLNLEDKKKAIQNHYQDNTEMAKRMILVIDNIPPFAFDKIWDSQKSFIFEKAAPRYSIFQAAGHINVYAIDILTKKRNEKEWISGLYKLARKIQPEATHVNIVFHQGDIQEEHDYLNYTYIFSEEELKPILEETSGISLNVISFSHTSESPIYLVLRDDYENKDSDIPDDIDSIHRKISYIAKDKAFRDNLLHTINGIKGGDDPIGNSYPEIINKKEI